jgi:hypothetical protein
VLGTNLQLMLTRETRLICLLLSIGCEPDQFVSMGSDAGGMATVRDDTSGGATSDRANQTGPQMAGESGISDASMQGGGGSSGSGSSHGAGFAGTSGLARSGSAGVGPTAGCAGGATLRLPLQL